MDKEEIKKRIDELLERKWILELGDEYDTFEYKSIIERLRELYKELNNE